MTHATPRLRFRTRYLIQPKFQILFSAVLILIALISALLVGFIIWLLIYTNNIIFVKYNVHTTPEYLSLIAKQGRVIVFAWIASFAVIATVLLVVGIFLSHRIAGPMYALVREMKKLQDGDLTAHLQLRKKDEFKELKAPFNHWVDSLQKMNRSDIANIERLKENLGTLLNQVKQKNPSDPDIPTLESLMGELDQLLKTKGTN